MFPRTIITVVVLRTPPFLRNRTRGPANFPQSWLGRTCRGHAWADRAQHGTLDPAGQITALCMWWSVICVLHSLMRCATAVKSDLVCFFWRALVHVRQQMNRSFPVSSEIFFRWHVRDNCSFSLLHVCAGYVIVSASFIRPAVTVREEKT